MKYKDWLNEWLNYYVTPTTKEQTYKKYLYIANHYIITEFGNCDISELSPIALQRFIVKLNEKELSANTINLFLSVIKSSLKRAAQLGILNEDPSSNLIRPKIREKRVTCFSKEEQKKIEKYVCEKNNPKLFGIILCLYTGIRIGELLALEWCDVDMQKGVIYISKTCSDDWSFGHYVKILDFPKTECAQRAIPIPKQLMQKLKEQKKRTIGNFVISGKSEYGIGIRSYQRTFKNLLKKLDIKHRGFHSLRHTFATRALECGMDIKTLSEILGHKNANVTLKRYAHSLIEHKREMMNKVGKFLL